MNAMIVDSSALSEQVVADALASAFDSAGQRCSALRVLCLQDDIADRRRDDAARRDAASCASAIRARLATDVGPVIDADAQAMLVAHVAQMRAAGADVFELPLPGECAPRDVTFAPTLIRSARRRGLRLTRGSVRTGPARRALAAATTLAHCSMRSTPPATALTHGIQTRIDETVAAILARIRAGNVYVNRNIIGAVVGVQPFGGDRLSGTGPKAGGPHYLPRLVRGAPPPLPTDVNAGEELPGPTGETNTLYLRPRGRVACVADAESELAAQARVATATRQHRAAAPHRHRAIACAAMAGVRCELVPDPLAAEPDVVLLRRHRRGVKRELRRTLAALARPDRSARRRRVPAVTIATRTLERAHRHRSTRRPPGGNASLLSLAEAPG